MQEIKEQKNERHAIDAIFNRDGLMSLGAKSAAELASLVRQVRESLLASMAPGLLVFLTGTAVGKAYLLAETFGLDTQFVSVGKFLVSNLLEVPRSRRPQKALQLLGEKAAAGPCCFYDLEILFDPGMKLNVLTSLKTLAKGREIYVDWPGEWKSDDHLLTFAESGDPAYQSYPLEPDVGLVDLSGETCPAFDQ